MLTIPEVAKQVRVSRRTVDRWIRDGKLEAVKIGTIIRVDEVALERFLVAYQLRPADDSRKEPDGKL